jgi:hypothetical protein
MAHLGLEKREKGMGKHMTRLIGNKRKGSSVSQQEMDNWWQEGCVDV